MPACVTGLVVVSHRSLSTLAHSHTQCSPVTCIFTSLFPDALVPVTVTQ